MTLVYYPSPILRTPKLEPPPPTQITPTLQRLVSLMATTMYAEKAAGIAAPQVGSLERVFLVDAKVVEEEGDPPPLVFINPMILSSSGQVVMQEGCLSFPGIFLDIARPSRVTMQAQDMEGKTFTVEAKGLFARVLLHEFDHIQGKLMIDHVSPIQRDRAQRAVSRWRREQGL